MNNIYRGKKSNKCLEISLFSMVKDCFSSYSPRTSFELSVGKELLI